MKTKYPFATKKKNLFQYTNTALGVRRATKKKTNKDTKRHPTKCSSVSNLSCVKNNYYNQTQLTQTIGTTPNTGDSTDYLNFSKMEINRSALGISNSFSDIFDGKYSNDRYDETDTPLNTSTLDKHINIQKNEQLQQTPSTICNYYQQSEQSTAKKNLNDNELRVNLNKLYANKNVKNNLSQNPQTSKITVNRNNKLSGKNTSSLTSANIPNNLMKNYLNNNKSGSDFKAKKFVKHKTTSMDTLKGSTISRIIKNKSGNSAGTGIGMNTTSKKTKQPKRISQQKPITLCFDHNKYENYFITPNSKRLKNSNRYPTKTKVSSGNSKASKAINVNKNNTNFNISNISNKLNSYSQISSASSKKNIQNRTTMPSSYSSSKIKANNGSSNKINYLKISKTLTEQNILNKIEATPKANRPSFISSLSSMAKKYTLSGKASNDLYSTAIKVGKAKTQSALKSKGSNLSFGSNIKEKDVKQKLIDRMNNAMKNNWTHVYKKSEEDKKKLMDNINAFIQTPNKQNRNFKVMNNMINSGDEKDPQYNEEEDFFNC